MTTASSHIDYFLSLDDEVDTAWGHYNEQLIRVEWINTVPFEATDDPFFEDNGIGDTPEITGGADEKGGRVIPVRVSLDTPATFGLAPESHDHEEVHTFLVLGRLFKLHPDFDEIILGILYADRLSCVVLIQERHELWTARVWERLQSAAQRREKESTAEWSHRQHHGRRPSSDIGGTMEEEESGHFVEDFNAIEVLSRVRFIHHWNYLRVLRLSYAVLDTFPYGGCLTSLESLSFGKPVLTLPSRFIRGRFTLAMYRQMGLDDPSIGLVAVDAASMVQSAIRIGTDRNYRRNVSQWVQIAYKDRLHRNLEAGVEWGRLFRALHVQSVLTQPA
uniref:O-GlcNAc transferase C-terminal domain-containing protein n=1 Tax=Octactis speculum TaxID=3111310 RepID=A0A7S2CRM6_9STRA